MRSLDRVLLLGGAGVVGREVARVLGEAGFTRLTIADRDGEAALTVTEALPEARGVETLELDLHRASELDRILQSHDVVFNAAPYPEGRPLIEAALRNRVHYLDLGGVVDPHDWDGIDRRAREAGVCLVFGCGATPGLSSLLAMAGARELQEIWSIQIAFASFRPMSLSPGLLGTLLDEFAADTEGRWVYEDGQLIEVPPFSRKRVVTFLPPVGPQRVVVVPHEEVFQLPRALVGVEEVAVLGTWRPAQMQLLRNLSQLGLLSRDTVELKGTAISPLEFLEAHFRVHPPPEQPGGCHFFLWVETQGLAQAGPICRRFRTAHPEWGERTTGLMTGIPAALALIAMADRPSLPAGARAMEQLVTLGDLENGLKRYEIEIEETETPLP